MDETTKHPLITDTSTACRVCRGAKTNPYLKVDECRYWSCPACDAIFLDETQLLNAKEEHQRYLLHNNDPADPRYREFVNRLGLPLLKKLKPRAKGLDYGCGPGPALGRMLCEKGYEMVFYDPFFQPSDRSVLKDTYDFIICSEVVEHFHRPAEESARLDAMLKCGGWLGIMTSFLTHDIEFKNWHYRRDPTHVAFYRETTFQYIAGQLGWKCQFPAKDIVLMQKSDPMAPFRGQGPVQEGLS